MNLKNGQMMTPELRSMMEGDIKECRSHTGRNGSQRLYQRMLNRYDDLIPDFKKNLSLMSKAIVPGVEPDYTEELKNIETKLETFLLLNHAFDESSVSNDEGSSNRTTNNRVFIVHGHDNTARLEVARVLEKAGFEAVILNEQPDVGQETIIDKLERYTDVSYAVILYTPCDEGKEKNESTLHPRARQNVVFEHGLLIEKLGRKRVTALAKDNVERPSDLSGIVFTRMDSDGGWKMKLAKSMIAAGMQFDMNRL